ncbi:hypothetical protein LINPERPRIM_LOCUS22294 [Linum perenne]
MSSCICICSSDTICISTVFLASSASPLFLVCHEIRLASLLAISQSAAIAAIQAALQLQQQFAVIQVQHQLHFKLEYISHALRSLKVLKQQPNHE